MSFGGAICAVGQGLDSGHDLSGEFVALLLGGVDRCTSRWRDRLADGDDVALAPAPLPPLGAGPLDVFGSHDRHGDHRRASRECHVGDATFRLAEWLVADDLALDEGGDHALGLEYFNAPLGRLGCSLRPPIYRDDAKPFQEASQERVLEQFGHRQEGDIGAIPHDWREQSDRVERRAVARCHDQRTFLGEVATTDDARSDEESRERGAHEYDAKQSIRQLHAPAYRRRPSRQCIRLHATPP